MCVCVCVFYSIYIHSSRLLFTHSGHFINLIMYHYQFRFSIPSSFIHVCTYFCEYTHTQTEVHSDIHKYLYFIHTLIQVCTSAGLHICGEYTLTYLKKKRYVYSFAYI